MKRTLKDIMQDEMNTANPLPTYEALEPDWDAEDYDVLVQYCTEQEMEMEFAA